ncbi:MAG TPA: hypothetical protein VHY30_02125 [Verrucomicrobiae bacterium]|jgi:hypothetical protein|nr:hypothetical protein [Verrucomicrobiae bacterium]
MKNMTKYSNYFGFALALCVMILSGCSCSAPKPTPDPLAGFHPYYKILNQSIVTDYQDYIQKLSPKEHNNIAYIESFEDGTAQHAVEIMIELNHTNWRHILIYDKDNKRIKTIKYVSGHSAS